MMRLKLNDLLLGTPFYGLILFLCLWPGAPEQDRHLA